jgi:DEAD/DEAH box helicase domain-containing protein
LDLGKRKAYETEAPISPDETFGDVDLPQLCEKFDEARFLHQSGGNWHWIGEAYQADAISLRSVTGELQNY